MHIQTTKPELLTAVTQAASAAGKEDWNGMHISIEGNQQVRFRHRIEVWHFKKLPVCPHCHHRLRVVGNA